jgi:hypothetical protein
LGKPARGVTILVHGDGTIPDPDDPKWGLWVRYDDPERDSVVNAFEIVGLKPPKPVGSVSVGDGEIVVIFGPDPQR